MLTAIVPLIVLIAGALLYGLTNGKPAEIGKIMFFCGLLALCLAMSNKAVHFG